MAQSLRQSELFAGNDWTAIYKSFTEVNFNSFDYDTIRQSMVDYIRQNYAEQYNDWVVQSEFVAILDLVAYLGQMLAFRMDINARENFIDVARKRDNILRLARFLSYNPRRNIPASGLLKLVGVKTTESIVDSSGNQLNNTKINWEDPSNEDWFDQFILVLNSSFVTTNPFGTYLDEKNISGVKSQIYRFDNLYNINSGQYNFTSTVSNSNMDFEIVNMKLDDQEGYIEVDPNPLSKFQLAYLNDGNGYSSNRTGFFSLFKQGNMQYSDYNIPTPITNNSITIDTNNINNNDVWVQSVNDNGYILSNGVWEKVGFIPNNNILKVISSSENITYNSTLSTTQNIYQISTLTNDQISIKFGDGNFGNIPTGNIRVWYRVSNGQSYYIRPDEIQNIPITISYYDTSGKTQTLTLYYSLEDTIVNASETQSNDDIKSVAGNMYSTQGRMVSSSDYNILPQSVGNALKVKSTNRYYSGQSKYIDLNDPTGQYQDTTMFSDDGYFYMNYVELYSEILSKSLSVSDMVYNNITKIISNTSINNFVLYEWMNNSNYPFKVQDKIYWKVSSNKSYKNTGLFIDENNDIISVGGTLTNEYAQKYISENSLLKFSNGSSNIWASVISISGDGSKYYNNSLEGPIVLNVNIPNGFQLIEVLPYFPSSFSIDNINLIVENINKGASFAIGYDYKIQDFYIIDNSNISISNYDYNSKGTNSDSSWIMRFDYSTSGWRILSRSLEYIFESKDSTKFYFIENTSVMNPKTGKTNSDTISILKYNSSSLTDNIDTSVIDSYSYNNGYVEPRRVKLSYKKTNGYISNPEIFDNILDINSGYVFHTKYIDINGNEIWNLTSDVSIYPDVTGNIIYYPDTILTEGVFKDSSGNISTDYVANYGTSNLSFKWNHVASTDSRLDPSISNIIDIFVLTNGYYNELLSWRENNYSSTSIPSQPTELDIQLSFSSIENYKMFSDEIIWRPAKFKMIGGTNADSNLQFKMMVVPLIGTKSSSGEIKANVVNLINSFFDVTKWDFGETFYASELIGYLHQQLVNSISSIVLVPNGSNQKFGNLFQINANSDELFFPTLTVDDVEIITSLTNTNLRIS